MKYIYGLHEPGGESIVPLPGGSSIVFTHELGHDPTVKTGYDYRQWNAYTVIARLNNGYFPRGTIPGPNFYQQFAVRCANWVAASTGCTHWIIGNEPNHSQEWPHGRATSRAISASEYVTCFNLCEEAIHAVQPNALLIPAPVAPWNIEVGDWLAYFQYVVENCRNIGGIGIHTYTHGSDASLITDNSTMEPPFQDRYFNFRAYRDFIKRVPSRLHHLPIFITETNQDRPWADTPNATWIQEAYKEIDTWNQNIQPTIHCLALYRWPKYDDRFIEGKSNVIADLRKAISYNYTVSIEDNDMSNVLVNSSFEGDYYIWKNANGVPQDEVKIATGWQPWWQPTDTRPEYKAATRAIDAKRVHTGNSAQQWFNNYATHTAGVYQHVVGLPVGKKAVLNGFVQCFSSNTDNFDKSDGRYRMRIGVNPYGNADPFSSDIIWSQTIQPYDKYVELTVEFETKSDRVTVFAWGQPEWRLKHNNAYVDDVTLTVEGGEPPQPPNGECDLRALYGAKAQEAQLLSEVYSEIAILYGDLADG